MKHKTTAKHKYSSTDNYYNDVLEREVQEKAFVKKCLLKKMFVFVTSAQMTHI